MPGSQGLKFERRRKVWEQNSNCETNGVLEIGLTYIIIFCISSFKPTNKTDWNREYEIKRLHRHVDFAVSLRKALQPGQVKLPLTARNARNSIIFIYKISCSFKSNPKNSMIVRERFCVVGGGGDGGVRSRKLKPPCTQYRKIREGHSPERNIASNAIVGTGKAASRFEEADVNLSGWYSTFSLHYLNWISLSAWSLSRNRRH